MGKFYKKYAVLFLSVVISTAGGCQAQEEEVQTAHHLSSEQLNDIYGSVQGELSFYGNIDAVTENVWFKNDGWVADIYEDMDYDGEDEQLVFYLQRDASMTANDTSRVCVDIYNDTELLDSMTIVDHVSDIMDERKMIDFTVDMSRLNDGRKVLSCTIYYNSDLTVDAYGTVFPEGYVRIDESYFYVLEDGRFALAKQKDCEAAAITEGAVNYKYLLSGCKARYEEPYEVYIEFMVFNSEVPEYDD